MIHTFFSCFYSLEKTLFLFIPKKRAQKQHGERKKETNAMFPNRFRVFIFFLFLRAFNRLEGCNQERLRCVLGSKFISAESELTEFITFS